MRKYRATKLSISRDFPNFVDISDRVRGTISLPTEFVVVTASMAARETLVPTPIASNRIISDDEIYRHFHYKS